MNTQTYRVQAEDVVQRADAYLARASGLTRSRIANLMEQGHVLREGKAARPGERVRAGECFTVQIPPVQAPSPTTAIT